MTDNSSDTPNGIETGTGEPSMEDILSSIRRIIAEDDEADHGHLDTGTLASFESSVEASTAIAKDEINEVLSEAPVEAQMADSAAEEDVLILDQLVSDATNAKELTEIETEELVIDTGEDEDFNPVSSVMNDLEDRLVSERDPVEDLIISNDQELDLNNLVYSNDDKIEEIANKPSSRDDLLNLESGKEEMLEALVAEVKAELPPKDETPVFNLIEEPSTSSLSDEAESDLDIVKSLMADLADTSFLGEDDALDTSDAFLDKELDLALSSEPVIDEIAEDVAAEAGSSETVDPVIDDILQDIAAETDTVEVQDTDDILSELGMDLVEPSDTTDADAEVMSEALDLAMADDQADLDEEDQILNEILELTIEDEEAVIADALELTVEEPVIESTSPEVSEDNPLLQIAAKAEADADAIDGTEKSSIVPAAIAATAVAAASQKDDRVEMDLAGPDGQTTEEILNELDLALAEVTQEDNQKEADAVPESEPEPETETLLVEPEETEDMPKAVRKEAIINEVTEEATVDAFAELSQAVEDKAVFTESGPRIGDIVQDALRPMLKEWLDENLKSIVERAVTKEVKRISSGK